jgi:hypothetical protein
MKIHPITIIVIGLFMISLGFNLLQYKTIMKLKEEKRTIIIRPHIKLYEKPDFYTTTDQGGVKVSTDKKKYRLQVVVDLEAT